MRRDLFRSHSFLGHSLFSWMIPKRLSVVCGKSAPPATTAATAPAPKRRRSRRVQRRKSCGATSITCAGHSLKTLAGLCRNTDSVEVLFESSPVCAFSSFIAESSPISPSSSTNLRSCCEACPSHQRERESRAVRQRERKPTLARSARCALCHNRQE